MTAAAFQATFADWRLIKGRKVVQVVLELPLEQADLAYQVLGGMPNPAESVWCAVARLQDGASVVGSDASGGRAAVSDARDSPSARPKRSWDQLSAAEQAGIRCAEPAFHKFLQERHPFAWSTTDQAKDRAAETLYRLLGVESRAHIQDKPLALSAWQDIDADYRIWMMVLA